MKLLTYTSDPYDVMGVYGPGPFRQGVLAEHLNLVDPTKVRTLTRTQWVVTDDGKAWPVLCGELIRVVTEDGPGEGRCGAPADPNLGACEPHAERIAEWRTQTEAETLAWEQQREWSDQ